MASVEEIRQARLGKVDILEKQGINPYPARVERSHSIFDLRENFVDLEKQGADISIVGRVMSLRGQGALALSKHC